VANSDDDIQDVAGILADRLAAVLVHHEPGWRLPRPSTLARRYNVRPAQVEQAVRELAARHLIRQLPDGQLYRASPAEYLIEVPGVPRLGASVDPMGSEVSCRNRKVSWRRVPEDVGWALGVTHAETVCSVRCHWWLNGEPAAISTTYLIREAAGQVSEAADPPGADGPLGLALLGADQRGKRAPLGRPAALHLEMQPPPSSVARGLRLGSGQPAAMVTVRYDDPVSGRPVALTVAALRPDLFRIVVESPADGGPVRTVAPTEALDDDTSGAADNSGVDGDQAAERPGDVTSAGPWLTALPS
jgi:hypothetical protein